MAPIDAPVRADPDSWHRAIGGWDAVFAMLAVLTGCLLAFDGTPSDGRRFTAFAVLAVLAAWYALVGARALRTDDAASGRRYVAVAMPLTLGLFTVEPAGALMLFVLYPHIWALLRVRLAAVASALTALGTAVALPDWSDRSASEAATILLLVAVSLAIAFLLGLWINRIIEQSRERARLVAELAAARTDLMSVSREAGMMAERERLARDIHDTLAQGFVSVILLLEAAETAIGRDDGEARARIGRARQTAAENLAESRALVAALMPPQLQESSLVEAVQGLVERMGRDGPATPGLRVDGDPRTLPASLETVLLRAVQEALSNARRHSGSKTVAVELAYLPDRTLARVSDDGQGFDVGTACAGYGLPGLRNRLADVGGSLAVDSAPGSGTTVTAEVPS